MEDPKSIYNTITSNEKEAQESNAEHLLHHKIDLDTKLEENKADSPLDNPSEDEEYLEPTQKN